MFPNLHPDTLIPFALVFGHKRRFVTAVFVVDHKVEIEVPSSLVSSAVRFKWKQENFENALEFWALDNVQVRMNLLDGVVHV